MSAYDNVQPGGLKLKKVSDPTIKKKKKKKNKDKEKKQLEFAFTNTDNKSIPPLTSDKPIYIAKKTKAEFAYEKAQEKRQADQILKKASTNHKEQIMELNRHLDTLTEHFDIPKVSWTK